MKIQPAIPNSEFEIETTSEIVTNTRRLSILIIGDSDSAIALTSLRKQMVDPNLLLLTCHTIEESWTLLASNSSIVLVLLLWQGDAPAQLPDLVQSIFERRSNAALALMVRSRTKLPQDICATLWHLGVVDRSFNQPLGGSEMVDSVVVAMRNCRHQITLMDIPALSEVFGRAKTLRDLALLSLQVVHEQGLPTRGGLFCYVDSSTERQPMLIAGTACHEDHNCIPLQRIGDRLAKDMIHAALEQRRSQFGADAMAIYLLTAAGNTVCIYFTLDFPLCFWEKGLLRGISNVIATAIDQSQIAQKLRRTQHATIITLSALAEFRDVDTGEHVARVARMTTEIAHMLSQDDADIDADFLEQVGLASILHDTGKIAIPDSILLKPGPLDPDERRVMEQHVIFGYEYLVRAARRTDEGALLTMAAAVARHHHERFDGKGYPDALKGENIPLSARIVALVDVYDALTCKRPYKLPWPHEKAVDLIRAESGRHFDPKVVDAFLQLEDMKRSARHIEWSDAMSVGNHDLDHDHQRLIEIINRLWMADSMGNRQIIEFVLDDLVNYTEFHFAREEGLLAKVGFSDMDRHIKIHRSICRRLEEVRWEYFQGMRDELRRGLLEFVTAWLNKHILEEDMQYSSHFAVIEHVPHQYPRVNASC